MSTREAKPSPIDPLIIVSFVADLATIVSFIGFKPDQTLRILVGAGLAALGTGVSVVAIISVLRFWLSPGASYAQPGDIRTRLIRSVLALVFSIGVGLAVVQI